MTDGSRSVHPRERCTNRSRVSCFSEKRYLTDYTVKRRKKYPFGIVCVDMTLSGECIEEIVFSGDFFGIQPVAGLEDALRGKRLANLPAIDPAPFIAGMTKEELVALLVSEA